MNKLDLPQGFENNILDNYGNHEMYDGSGWNYEIQDCLLEIENDKIIKVWY